MIFVRKRDKRRCVLGIVLVFLTSLFMLYHVILVNEQDSLSTMENRSTKRAASPPQHTNTASTMNQHLHATYETAHSVRESLDETPWNVETVSANKWLHQLVSVQERYGIGGFSVDIDHPFDEILHEAAEDDKTSELHSLSHEIYAPSFETEPLESHHQLLLNSGSSQKSYDSPWTIIIQISSDTNTSTLSAYLRALCDTRTEATFNRASAYLIWILNRSPDSFWKDFDFKCCDRQLRVENAHELMGVFVQVTTQFTCFISNFLNIPTLPSMLPIIAKSLDHRHFETSIIGFNSIPSLFSSFVTTDDSGLESVLFSGIWFSV